jgi:hypothetical protein
MQSTVASRSRKPRERSALLQRWGAPAFSGLGGKALNAPAIGHPPMAGPGSDSASMTVGGRQYGASAATAPAPRNLRAVPAYRGIPHGVNAIALRPPLPLRKN